MKTQKMVTLLVGSLRKESFSRKLANSLITLSTDKIDLKILEISNLSLYNQDFDFDPSALMKEFRSCLKKSDGFIFITPEYNRSVPGVLKNAIDIGSRPYGENAFDAKPSAVISLSIGAMGGFGANHHLRQSLVFLNSPTMPQPEVYIGHADKIFDLSGKLTDESTRKYLLTFLSEYYIWIQKF
jgi:chromate reductase